MEAQKIAETGKPAERNHGIDLLRVLSMWMIVILHVLGQGGVLAACPPGSVRYGCAWLWEIAAYCAVNCFAIISGYVAVDAKFHIRRILLLWLQVAFFSVVLTFGFVLAGKQALTLRSLVDTLFPVVANRWWYVTAYFGIFFFTPFIGKMFDGLSRKQGKLLVLAIFFLFSVVPTLFNRDPFWTREGYSTLWLLALFVVGAYLKRFPPAERLHRWGLLLYLLCILLVWGSKLGIEAVTLRCFGARKWGGLLVSYTSPPILLAAVFLTLYFSRLRLGRVGKRIVGVLSPLAFGVYLLHTHPSVWNYVLPGLFAELAALHPVLLLLTVPAAAGGVFLVCAALDWVRGVLFKGLRLPALTQWAETRLLKCLDRLN